MLFVATILAAVGYTFIYAGVKGDKYKIGGQAVWQQPWLPFFAVFSRRADLAATVTEGGDPEQFYLAALQANSGSSSSPSSPSSPAAPAQGGGVPGAPPAGLPAPGPGQSYA